MEHEGIKGILQSGRAPGLTNMNKGPGCGSNESVFARPDPLKDGLIVAKKIEADGKMTPEMEGHIRFKIDQLERKPPKKHDYDKEGHPLDSYTGPPID